MTLENKFSAARVAPLIVIAALFVAGYLLGWHRYISFETLVRHRAAIDAFVAAHKVAAVAAFIGIYVAVAALSIPASAALTTIGGFLFGTGIGGAAAIVGATTGGSIIFLIAKSALGEHLLRRAGPFAKKFARGFREDAFSYML